MVDRFKVRDDLTQRLAESFETALELSGGTAVVADMDDPKAEELLFSANFACPICGYSMRELEPRLFSFNNPAGACPTCDGLGVQQYFDPDRVIQNPELSLAGGAIRGWDRRNFYYFQMLKSLADHYKFDVEAPWGSLSANVHKVVLYGSGKENIEFKYMNDRGDTSIRRHPFEGVLHNMERRYKETESSAVREELAKFISNRPCASCRRNPSASGSAPCVCREYAAACYLRHEHRSCDGILQQSQTRRSASEDCGKKFLKRLAIA